MGFGTSSSISPARRRRRSSGRNKEQGEKVLATGIVRSGPRRRRAVRSNNDSGPANNLRGPSATARLLDGQGRSRDGHWLRPVRVPHVAGGDRVHLQRNQEEQYPRRQDHRVRLFVVG